jgi:hypothetical protein
VIKTVGEFMDAVNALLSSGVLTREMPVKCAWEGCSWPVHAVAAEPITVNPPPPGPVGLIINSDPDYDTYG